MTSHIPECLVCHKTRASAKPGRSEKIGELKVFQPPYPIGCQGCGRGNGITVLGTIEALDAIRDVPEPNLILTKADVDAICFQCKNSFSKDEDVLETTDTKKFSHIHCADFKLEVVDGGKSCFQCKSSFSKDDLVLRTTETRFGGKKYKKEFFHVGCANPFSSDKSINPVRHAALLVKGGFGQKLLKEARIILKKVATAKIMLTLWEEDTERFRVGDIVRVENGYAYPRNAHLVRMIGRHHRVYSMSSERDEGQDQFPHISAGYYGEVNSA